MPKYYSNGKQVTKEEFDKANEEAANSVTSGHPSLLVKTKDNKYEIDYTKDIKLKQLDRGSEVLQYYWDPLYNNDFYLIAHARREQFNGYRRMLLCSAFNFDKNIEIKPRHKLLILSDPNKDWLDYARSKGLKVVYDRSDAWFALFDYDKNDKLHRISDDLYCCEKADLVVCSSKWLYNHTYNENKKYIPNSYIYQEYRDVEKYEKPTAIYAGIAANKLDFDYLRELIDSNKDIDFKLYVQDIGFPEDLAKYLCPIVDTNAIFEEMLKCHYALLPLNSSDWASGMLPLKTFQYLNAHIPILCSNTWNGWCNVEDLPNVFKISSKTKISDMKLDLKPFPKYDWNQTIEQFRTTIDDFLASH